MVKKRKRPRIGKVREHKPRKCPGCGFHSRTLKGIEIHRRMVKH
jgi:hypothetical protein